MATIYSLPPELHDHIFGYLRHDRPLLCQIARSSRRLHDAVAPVLYQEISILVSFRHSQPTNDSVWPMDHIMDLVSRKRAIGAYVRSAHVKDDRFETSSDDTIGRQMSSLLAMLPKLRMLQIDRDQHRKLSRLNLSFLDRNPMTCLRSVHIKDRTLSSTDLLRLLLLERIESVTAVNFVDSNVPAMNPKWRVARHKKPSVALHLLQSGILPVHVHGDVMQNILEWSPSNLNNLTCFIPGVYEAPSSEASSKYAATLNTNISYPILSPSLLQAALKPMQECIEHLEVSRGTHGIQRCGGGNMIRRLPGDGSQVDFSPFINVRTLKVNSVCIFGKRVDLSHRRGVFERLPRSLEKLEITFDSDCGMFWPSRAEWDWEGDSGEEMLSVIHPMRYAWLDEILEAKDMRYPNLTHVDVREEPVDAMVLLGLGGEANVKSNGFRWTVPRDLEEKARLAGVEIGVWLEMHPGNYVVGSS